MVLTQAGQGKGFSSPSVRWKACGFVGIPTHTSVRDVQRGTEQLQAFCIPMPSHGAEKRNSAFTILLKARVEKSLTYSGHLRAWLKRGNNDLQVILEENKRGRRTWFFFCSGKSCLPVVTQQTAHNTSAMADHFQQIGLWHFKLRIRISFLHCSSPWILQLCGD